MIQIIYDTTWYIGRLRQIKHLRLRNMHEKWLK